MASAAGHSSPADSATADSAPLPPWESFRRRLAKYVVPPQTLRLSNERVPFADMPDDLLWQVANRALRTPERRGRLTSAVRHLAGQRTETPLKYVVVESHIDLTMVDSLLTRALVDLGYEPDNFAKMSPAKYRFHFTLQYTCGSGTRARVLYGDVARSAQEAAQVLQNHPVAVGYVETEIYRSEYSIALPPTRFSQSRSEPFPFTNNTFQSDPAPDPDRDLDGGAVEPSIDGRRAADIHVKIPGNFPEWTRPRDSVDPDAYHPARELKESLEGSGFYEILSDAGNFIYSAHFAALPEANQVFRALVAFAHRSGGIVGVAREICTGLWRTTRERDGSISASEVPPLLRFCADPTATGEPPHQLASGKLPGTRVQ